MKPNIVFAFADDWGRYASAYRHLDGPNSLNALIETPNFEASLIRSICSLQMAF